MEDFVGFLTSRIMTKSQFIMESQEYKFIKQAVIISERIIPPYSSKFSKSKCKQYQLFVILL